VFWKEKKEEKKAAKSVFFSLMDCGAFRLVCNASFRLCPFLFYCIWSRRNKK